MTTPRVTVPVEPTPDAYKIAASIAPDLFSGDYETAHRAASPYRIDVKQREKAEQVQAVIDLYRAMLSAAPAPEGGAFDGESDGDTPLQAAAREAGWALSSMIDSAPWERRGQLQRIVERLGSAIDRLVWPWPGDDDRHDQIRAAWRAYADDHADDDGKIDVTEVDTCVAIACMKTIQLLSPALASREEAPAEAGEAARIVARHLPLADAPDTVCLPITMTAGDLRAVYAALRAQPPARDDAQPVGWLRAVDEEMVCAHLGVADAEDSFETAKKKLASLIQWNIAVATDPSVGGHPAPDALRGAMEALEPFAAVMADIGESEDDADSFRNPRRDYAKSQGISVGHIRRARQALAALQQEGRDRG